MTVTPPVLWNTDDPCLVGFKALHLLLNKHLSNVLPQLVSSFSKKSVEVFLYSIDFAKMLTSALAVVSAISHKERKMTTKAYSDLRGRILGRTSSTSVEDIKKVLGDLVEKTAASSWLGDDFKDNMTESVAKMLGNSFMNAIKVCQTSLLVLCDFFECLNAEGRDLFEGGVADHHVVSIFYLGIQVQTILGGVVFPFETHGSWASLFKPVFVAWWPADDAKEDTKPQTKRIPETPWGHKESLFMGKPTSESDAAGLHASSALELTKSTCVETCCLEL